MTATILIHTTGIEDMEAVLGQLTSAQMGKIMRPAVMGGLAILQEYIAKYPGRPHYPIRWASARQRRFVMAKLRREGMPYVRRGSAGVGGAWTSAVTDAPQGIIGVLGNNAPHAIFVQGPRQQPFHADTGWRTDAETLRVKGPEAVAKIEAAISRAIDRINSK